MTCACGKKAVWISHWKLIIPNPLCWMFEFQSPRWMWHNLISGLFIYYLHKVTCKQLLIEHVTSELRKECR